MNTAVIIALVGLILVMCVHIAVIARWTGRIDSYIQATDNRIKMIEDEIKSLRNARHEADGKIARHEGLLRELDRRSWVQRTSDSESGG